MECHSKNTSLDSLLNNEREVKAKEHHKSKVSGKGASKEEVKRKKHRHHKHKSEHRRREDFMKQGPFTNTFETNITQKIQVDRQGYQCIINLNTKICNHQSNHGKSDEQDSPQSPIVPKRSIIIERSVPHCFRTVCRQPTKQQTRPHTHIRQHCKTGYHHHHRGRESHKCLHRSRHVSKYRHHHHRYNTINSKKIIQTENENKRKLSPETKVESKYENISSTSFESFLETPLSYKGVKITSEKHVSKLDTLIKRTKERERKLVLQSRKCTQWCTSTPAYTEVTSIDFPASCSEINLSLHSRSTLIIEPRETGYSPIEGFYMSPKTERILYSPISPEQNEDCWHSDFELKIKSEPTMDIEVYSPTQSPEIKLFEFNKTVKKETKVDPKIEKA